jgi:hypothetical protein
VVKELHVHTRAATRWPARCAAWANATPSCYCNLTVEMLNLKQVTVASFFALMRFSGKVNGGNFQGERGF